MAERIAQNHASSQLHCDSEDFDLSVRLWPIPSCKPWASRTDISTAASARPAVSADAHMSRASPNFALRRRDRTRCNGLLQETLFRRHFKFALLSRRMARFMDVNMRITPRKVRSEGVAASATLVLNRLYREGPMRLTALALAEGASQSGMTQLVQRMERQGLLERWSDPDDGRASLVMLGESGRHMWDARADARRQRIAEFARGVPRRSAGIVASRPGSSARSRPDARDCRLASTG